MSLQSYIFFGSANRLYEPTRQKRSATVQAEVPSVLYELSADAYERASSKRTARSPKHFSPISSRSWPNA